MGPFDAYIKRKGVTLALLWEEYNVHHPEGYNLNSRCFTTSTAFNK
jgi:transposase